MRDILLKNAEAYIGHSFQAQDLRLSEGKIAFAHPDADESDCEVIDLAGKKVAPGMIDVHTHGAAGVDVNAANAEGLEKIGRFFASNGTTAWLASVLTDTKERTLRCLDQYRSFGSPDQSAQLLGIHLEGPFLSPKYKGAMPETLLRTADPDLVKEYQDRAEGGIRTMTVAPEVEGVIDLIPHLTDLGIVPAIGHSGADYETAMRAIEAGAKVSTHTGNAMRLLNQHEPAIFGAAMESDICCEMICDGMHLHPGVVRFYLKMKGAGRLIGITDSIMAAGLPDGQYRLGVNEVFVKGKDAKLSDGTRAGSTLTQIDALRNVVEFTGRPLEEILPIYTENPAKLIGVFDRKGSIAPGKDADLMVLDEDLQIEKVFLRGRCL